MKFNINEIRKEIAIERYSNKIYVKNEPWFFNEYVKHVVYKGQILSLTDILDDETTTDHAFSLYYSIVLDGTLDENSVILALEELVRDFELIVNKKLDGK